VKAAFALAAALALAACNVPARERSPEPGPTRAATDMLRDSLVQAAVKATLVADDPDSTATVGVSVVDGVATLRGTVKDGATRARLGAAAAKVRGVKQVVNDLRVDPHGPRLKDQVGDVTLAARIQAAIVAQVGVQRVTVRVDRGVATLDGTVRDAKTKETIEATARGTSGIRNVVDRIRVAVP
jgi:hyperosmotically inducible protein